MDGQARKFIGPLTYEQAKEREMARLAFADEMELLEAHAEAQLQQDVTSVPDTIYYGLQEEGYFSADPVIDADPAIQAKAKTLHSLIKEQGVTPEGHWAISVTDREITSIRQGEFCPNCGERSQHGDEWERRMVRLEGRIGPRPEGATSKTNCCFCGFKLGIHGTYAPEGLHSREAFQTPDQQRLLDEFFPDAFTERDARYADANGGGAGDAGGERDGAVGDE